MYIGQLKDAWEERQTSIEHRLTAIGDGIKGEMGHDLTAELQEDIVSTSERVTRMETLLFSLPDLRELDEAIGQLLTVSRSLQGKKLRFNLNHSDGASKAADTSSPERTEQPSLLRHSNKVPPLPGGSSQADGHIPGSVRILQRQANLAVPTSSVTLDASCQTTTPSISAMTQTDCEERPRDAVKDACMNIHAQA